MTDDEIDAAIREVTAIVPDSRDRAIYLAGYEAGVEAREKRVAELEAALADERWRREAAAAEVKTSPKDSARMLWLVRDSGVDQIGEIDLHAEASIYAQIFGRAEANDDDYIAAIRTAIDSARYKD